jgi:hypothetical protein
MYLIYAILYAVCVIYASLRFWNGLDSYFRQKKDKAV